MVSVKHLLASFLLGVALVTAGACYESSAPLSAPGQVPLDGALLGAWHCTPDPPTGNDSAELRVFRYDDRQYYVEWQDGADLTRYRAFGSRVGSETLLNVIPLALPDETGKFMFVRDRLDRSGTLRLSIVNADAVKGLDEAAALRAIRSRASDDKLFGPWAVCGRTSVK
jgi:hypothetical protein